MKPTHAASRHGHWSVKINRLWFLTWNSTGKITFQMCGTRLLLPYISFLLRHTQWPEISYSVHKLFLSINYETIFPSKWATNWFKKSNLFIQILVSTNRNHKQSTLKPYFTYSKSNQRANIIFEQNIQFLPLCTATPSYQQTWTLVGQEFSSPRSLKLGPCNRFLFGLVCTLKESSSWR